MNISPPPARHPQDPIAALLDQPKGAVLAVISGLEGPSYRPVGAMMSVLADGRRVGTLSSGCIEGDIAFHAAKVAESQGVQSLRYGRNSPFKDIELPCGGGLDILLLPHPNLGVLQDLQTARSERRPVALQIALDTGTLQIKNAPQTERARDHLTVHFAPPLRFAVFGKGPEATTFAALTRSAGYDCTVTSPDSETLEAGRLVGCQTRHITSPHMPDDQPIDARTAIVLFFHDHEWEPPILAQALKTPAFYIGAQGSQRARDTRLMQMEVNGTPRAELARLHGPIGLIPSARDAGTLAVSVLAEVLAKAMPGR